MDFKEMNCPFCKGLLKVPTNLTTCVCMYCGKKIEIDIVDKTVENCHEYENLCEIAMNQGANILLKHLDLMKSFKANLYEDAFKGYLDECLPIIQALDKACARLPYIDRNQLSKQEYSLETEQQLVDVWVKRVLDDMEITCKIKRFENGKSSNSRKLDENRFILALYMVPMIRETRLEVAESIADSITMEWGRRYPLQKFSKADYAEIRDGFKKRKLCFITTAVCESLGKPDDCNELQLFRTFRDSYLLNTEEGTSLVEEYYEIAPSIVNAIKVLEEQDEIYMSLWQEYLEPCFNYIKMGQENECKKIYVKMVKTLSRSYLYQ
ncbi:CFI-box-CTERM domain-containing protein [Anaerosporobacter sp.]